MKKVLYVDIEYDYGQKARGPNTIAHDGFIRGFKNAGVELQIFFYDSYLQNGNEQLQKDLIKKVEEFRPDLTFFVIFRDHFKFETLDYLKTITTTVNWFGDDTWRFDSFTKLYAPHFSRAVTTEKYIAIKYIQELKITPIMSQWAAIETPAASFTNYEFDVSFVGGAHVTRQWFVSELQKRGINVACFGHGWPNGSVSSTRMYEIFRRSKINLNLSNSKTLDIRFLLSSLKNLYIGLRASKDAPQIKARNFEILQAGGFQISDYVPSLEMYLDIGKDIVCYKNVEEAAMLINYYLKMEEEREQIRAQGEQTVRQGHTYTHRLLSLMKEVFS